MIRLFQVYYPLRTLVLFVGEAILVCASFLIASLIQFGPDSYLVLNYENGFYKVLAITSVAVLCSYYFDLYAPQQLNSRSEAYFRMLLVLGLLSFLLAGTAYWFPDFLIGRNVYLLGLVILTAQLMWWRLVYGWLIRSPYLQERVYVVGAGHAASTLVDSVRKRRDLGLEVVGWTGAIENGSFSRETMGRTLASLRGKQMFDRLIVALSDRRGIMPIAELLDLRLEGIKIEDATSLLEKISGKIETDGLCPSSLIFSEGFRLSNTLLLFRRALSFFVALLVTLICLPLIPLVAAAIKLSSPGPILYRQERVGHKGEIFILYKFRTMFQDAEAQTGAVWAAKSDPRITKVGRFLRTTRLDEIPQLWNVLRGDMAFVGPRPERPEFVQWFSNEIPYYQMRHIIRPGITGWAQVRYQYGSCVEETKEKLRYDLYYIKHMSLVLDLLVILETVRTVLHRRGAQ